MKPNNDQSGSEGDGHSNGVAVPDLNGPIEVSKEWGIEEELWDRNWSELSGGEAQRIALATGVGLKNAEILLLDGKQDVTISWCRHPIITLPAPCRTDIGVGCWHL